MTAHSEACTQDNDAQRQRSAENNRQDKEIKKQKYLPKTMQI
jgi:hypothetical protein